MASPLSSLCVVDGHVLLSDVLNILYVTTASKSFHNRNVRKMVDRFVRMASKDPRESVVLAGSLRDGDGDYYATSKKEGGLWVDATALAACLMNLLTSRMEMRLEIRVGCARHREGLRRLMLSCGGDGARAAASVEAVVAAEASVSPAPVPTELHLRIALTPTILTPRSSPSTAELRGNGDGLQGGQEAPVTGDDSFRTRHVTESMAYRDESQWGGDSRRSGGAWVDVKQPDFYSSHHSETPAREPTSVRRAPESATAARQQERAEGLFQSDNFDCYHGDFISEPTNSLAPIPALQAPVEPPPLPTPPDETPDEIDDYPVASREHSILAALDTAMPDVDDPPVSPPQVTTTTEVVGEPGAPVSPRSPAPIVVFTTPSRKRGHDEDEPDSAAKRTRPNTPPPAPLAVPPRPAPRDPHLISLRTLREHFGARDSHGATELLRRTSRDQRYTAFDLGHNAHALFSCLAVAMGVTRQLMPDRTRIRGLAADVLGMAGYLKIESDAVKVMERMRLEAANTAAAAAAAADSARASPSLPALQPSYRQRTFEQQYQREVDELHPWLHFFQNLDLELGNRTRLTAFQCFLRDGLLLRDGTRYEAPAANLRTVTLAARALSITCLLISQVPGLGEVWSVKAVPMIPRDDAVGGRGECRPRVAGSFVMLFHDSRDHYQLITYGSPANIAGDAPAEDARDVGASEEGAAEDYDMRMVFSWDNLPLAVRREL